VEITQEFRRPVKGALITGIIGQDSPYLAKSLINGRYEVHAIIRSSSTFCTSRIDHMYVDLHNPGARLTTRK